MPTDVEDGDHCRRTSLAEMLGVSSDDVPSMIERASNRSCGLPGYVVVPDGTSQPENQKEMTLSEHLAITLGRGFRL